MKRELKTDREVFKAEWSGDKTYEIRFDDRQYAVMDILMLRETQYSGEEMKCGMPLVYTKHQMAARVTHILRGPIYGLQEGWVIMSIVVTHRSFGRKE